MSSPRTSSPFLPTIPQISTPFVDPSGCVTLPWLQLLIKCWQAITPQAPQTVVPTGSPFSWTASAAGTLMVSAGAVTISRQGVAFAIAPGAIPVSQGDTVTVTYTSAPTIGFFPG